MIKVTKQEFQEWIKAQPDDRPVDMQIYSNTIIEYDYSPCGCAMWEYAKDHYFPDFDACGDSSWNVRDLKGVTKPIAKFIDVEYLGNIIDNGVNNPSKTFGELKKQLL